MLAIFLRALLYGLVCLLVHTGAVAQSSSPSSIDFSAIVTKPGATPRLTYVPSPSVKEDKFDICQKCLTEGVAKWPVCAYMLCQRGIDRAKVTVIPILAPKGADSTALACGKVPALKPYCGIPVSPVGSATPGADPPQPSVIAYKRMLEVSRVGADSLRQQGALTREEHAEFLRSYRQDWKVLMGQ